MLPKQYRLKNKDDFQRVYKEGRFFSFDGIVVNFLDNNKKISRFGFVVSKNYSSLATERNRAKRILRACVEKMLKKLPTGIDFVLGIKKGFTEKIDSSGAQASLERAFKKNKFLN